MSRRSVPAGADERYGWSVVAVFAVTETVSWGVLYYAFAVILPEMQRSLGWSKTELTGAFSLGLATSALAAFPVGRWLDHHDARALMTLGSLGGSALVLAWSQVDNLAVLYVIWAGVGLAMACVLYDAAFIVVTKRFGARRRQALTVVTLFSGCASFVFSPLTNWLIDTQGWRTALIELAVILATLTAPLHALFLRPAPAERRAPPSRLREQPTAPPKPATVTRDALGTAAFWYFTAAFVFSSFAVSAIAIHLIPYLIQNGRSAGFAALAAGLMGLLQVPGRLIFAGAAKLLPRRYEASSVLLLQAFGVAALATTTSAAGAIVAVCLFGIGSGMATLVRATALAEAYGATFYGSIAGVAVACATGARAIGPVATAAAYVAFNGYAPVLWLIAAGVLLGAASAGLASRTLPVAEDHA